MSPKVSHKYSPEGAKPTSEDGRKLRGETRAVARGTVKCFSEEKGYGFIAPDDDDGEDIFVHYTEVEGSGFRSLAEGERVSYEPAWSVRGARSHEEAKEVRRVE